MLHCLDEETIEPYMDEDRDYLGYLIRRKEAGRIRNIGFSSHAKTETLKRFLDWYDRFDMALIQLNYLDWKLLDGCSQYEILKEHNIPVWVMEPMKGGILSALNEEAAGILKAEAPSASISSWGFRFLYSLDNVQTVLSGMSSVEQVKENAELFDRLMSLDENEMKTLMKASDVFIKGMGVPCSGCGYCRGLCSVGIDIPLMIKAFNEHSVGGETWKIEGLSCAVPASECVSCGACVKRCPQNIQIPEFLERFNLQETIVTVDAIGGCRRVIEAIETRGGSYVIPVKENQPGYLRAIKEKVKELEESGEIIELDFAENVKQGAWENREIQTCKESRTYVITNLEGIDAETLLKIKRSHRNIEAQHWVLDVQLKEDGKTARKGNAVPTAATLRRFCLAVRKHDSEYAEKPVKRFFMANNHDIARIGKLLFEKEYCDM